MSAFPSGHVDRIACDIARLRQSPPFCLRDAIGSRFPPRLRDGLVIGRLAPVRYYSVP